MYSAKGPLNPAWRGDETSYSGVHRRVYRARGKASDRVCRCGKRWAHDWANLTGNLGDPYDYAAMCCLCHKRFDAKGVTFNGVTMSLTEWAETLGISYSTLAGRFSRGWSIERAFTEPIGASHGRNQWST